MKRLLAAVAVALALAGTALAASAAQVFNDPSGDSNGAPDITEVQFGTDVVRGHLVLWVTTDRLLLLGDEALLTYMDTDLNGDTGSPNHGGADYGVETTVSGSRLYRWDGSTWVQTTAPSLFSVWIPIVNALRLQLHPRDLAGTRGFNFYLTAIKGTSADDIRRDIAPDGDDLWTYSLESGPLRLSKEQAAATPARAGRPFTLRLEVGREDINEILEEGTVTCRATLAGKAIRGTLKRFADDGSTCTWRLPRSATRKRLSARITVSHGGASVSHSFAGTVRR